MRISSRGAASTKTSRAARQDRQVITDSQLMTSLGSTGNSEGLLRIGVAEWSETPLQNLDVAASV